MSSSVIGSASTAAIEALQESFKTLEDQMGNITAELEISRQEITDLTQENTRLEEARSSVSSKFSFCVFSSFRSKKFEKIIIYFIYG